MKLATNVTLAIIILWVVIAIVDMWFDIISSAAFYKLTITLGLITVVMILLALLKGGISNNESCKDKHLD